MTVKTEAIETALYALQALENCLRSNTKDRRLASPSRLVFTRVQTRPAECYRPQYDYTTGLPIFLTRP